MRGGDSSGVMSSSSSSISISSISGSEEEGRTRGVARMSMGWGAEDEEGLEPNNDHGARAGTVARRLTITAGSGGGGGAVSGEEMRNRGRRCRIGSGSGL